MLTVEMRAFNNYNRPKSLQYQLLSEKMTRRQIDRKYFIILSAVCHFGVP